MASIIFKLRFVPEDEAQDIRALLTEKNINYYETSAGAFGISMPALWLKDEGQKEAAKQLINEYQKERQAKAQDEYATQKANGTNRTIVDMFKENPPRFAAYIISIIALLCFSIFIFFSLGT